jgi:hypothetical protein
VAVAALASSSALADDDRSDPHVALGVGGHGMLIGPARGGAAAELELYPGGGFSRLGIRAAYLGLDGFAAPLVTAGPTFTVGTTRPHVHVALHADLAAGFGAASELRGLGAGVQAQLWPKYPFAIGVDATAHVLFRDGEPELALAVALTGRLSL